MYKELLSALERKQYLSILVDSDEEDELIQGVPVAVSEDFLVLQEISDFYFFGYQIVRIENISELKRDATDAFVEHIMRQEGIIDQVQLKHPIVLDDWKSIFQSLLPTGLAVTIQCDTFTDSAYFIGPVKKVDEDAVWIHYFDPEGVLSDAWEDVVFDEIVRVGFDEPYANMYSKHLRSLN